MVPTYSVKAKLRIHRSLEYYTILTSKVIICFNVLLRECSKAELSPLYNNVFLDASKDKSGNDHAHQTDKHEMFAAAFACFCSAFVPS